MDSKAHRRHKAALTFEFLDVSKSGVLTLQQMLLFPRNLEAAGKVDIATRASAVYTEYFKRMLTAVNKDPKSYKSLELTKGEYIDANETLHQTVWFREEFLNPMLNIYFDSIDRKEDASIQIDGWRRYYKSRGIENEDFIQSTFAKMDRSGNGLISRDEFKQAFAQFGSGEDQGNDYSFLFDTNPSEK